MDDRLTVLWMTDLHLLTDARDGPGEADGVRHGVLNMWRGPRRLAAFVERVNAERPHLALCTGDIIDSQTLWRRHVLAHRGELAAYAERLPHPWPYEDYDARRHLAHFMECWRAIDPSVRRELTIGNHDVMALPRDELARLLEAGDQPWQAGSPFNRSVVLEDGRARARFVLVDSSLGADALHWCYTGTLLPETLAWIEAELAAATEPVVFLAMHHGPHRAVARDPYGGDGRTTQFEPAAARALAAIADTASVRRPDQRFAVLFGHQHGNRVLTRFDDLGPALPGYLCPCLIDYRIGKGCRITVAADGHYTIEEVVLDDAESAAAR